MRQLSVALIGMGMFGLGMVAGHQMVQPPAPDIIAAPLAAIGIKPVAKPTPIIVPATYDGCSNCDAFARKIAYSIDHDPASWSVDDMFCHFTHKGIDLWIGNGDWDVNFQGQINNPPWLKQEGETPDGATPEQKLIWRAYIRWRNRHPIAEPTL